MVRNIKSILDYDKHDNSKTLEKTNDQILPNNLRPFVFIGDVIEQLKRIPGNSIDLAITSPPYWGQRDYGIKGQIGIEKDPEEYINTLLMVFDELKRVLKDTGSFF